MKTRELRKYFGLALAVAAMSISANTLWAADDIIVGPSGSQSGTSGAAPDYEWQNMWGPAYVGISFDAGNPPTSGDTAGSIYIQGNWPGSDADNYCIGSPGNWYGAVTFDASQYTSIEMDIKYNTTSTLAPAANAHLNIGFDQGYNGIYITNVSFAPLQPIADGSWHHLSIPVPSTISAPTCHSVGFYQWNPSPTVGTMNFWVANVKVIARVLPTPPPTILPLAKTSKGFNVIYNTPGQYDRHEARLNDQPGTVGDTGKSWVGHATVANPVVYTYTISSFPPISVANPSGCESYLFLVPNPGFNDNAPDWNEPNAVVASIQQGTNTATLTLQYKINEPNNNAMYGGGSQTVSDSNPSTYTNYVYYTMPVGSLPGGGITNVISPGVLAITNETGNLGSVTVTNPSPAGAAVGKWTIKFTSDTDVTLIGPDGTSSNFTIPSYNVGNFAETSGFNVYLGGQPNQLVALNSAVVYSSFAVSNTVAPFYDNFLTDTSLGTNWDTSVSSGPSGKLVVPATASYWVTWSLPATGFSLETGSSLNNLSAWTSPNIYPVITLNGQLAQLVDSSELPAGPTAFFNTIKRTFSQLQILLPGETNAPGTLTGKVGTPLPTTVSGSGTDVTVNAVDSAFHIISGVYDQIHLTTTDSGAFLPADAAMNNGTVTFTGANNILWGNQGTFTVTATDITSTNIVPVTSSPIVVGL